MGLGNHLIHFKDICLGEGRWDEGRNGYLRSMPVLSRLPRCSAIDLLSNTLRRYIHNPPVGRTVDKGWGLGIAAEQLAPVKADQ